MLNRGESPLKGEEPGLEEILKKVSRAGKFTCTSDFPKIRELDAVTLSIQTPFKNKEDLLPDFSALNEGIRNVAEILLPACSSCSSPRSRRGPPTVSPGMPSKRGPV